MIRIQSSIAMGAGLFLIASVCLTAAVARPQQREKGTGAAPKAQAPAVPAAGQSEMVAPSVTRPRAEYQFPVGQTYVYGAEWRVFNAGIATLRMEKAGQENRIAATADAAGTISLLYHVQDRLESFFGPSDFCSHNTSRHIEEGFRRVESNITFDYQRGKALLDHKNIRKKESKHEEHDIPGCVTDMLSSVYYVASLPLLPGKTYSFPINDGGATLTVLAHVEEREQVKTPAGTFKTIRVQPETASGALRDKGKIWVWYSDDAARIPVQMRARMSWGTLTFSLLRVDKK
ncbi:MAG TPA: DUF3108 domain-containing protein [Candidatus Angelobacter sp.]|nr:DUF3108 domain-containing protein [Candidatus Angelobacter sp.]